MAAGHHQYRLWGDDLKTLFFTSRNHLGSVNINIAGIPAPPRRRHEGRK